MVHSGGIGPGGTTVVRSMESITAVGWHPVPEFLGNRRPSAMETAAGSALAEGAAASASACGADGRPHGSKKNTRPGDVDGLLEGLEGRRGAILPTVYPV